MKTRPSKSMMIRLDTIPLIYKRHT